MYHTHARMHVDRNLKKSLFNNHPSVSPEAKLPIWRPRCGNVLPGQGCHKVIDVYEAAVPSDQHMKTKNLKENAPVPIHPPQTLWDMNRDQTFDKQLTSSATEQRTGHHFTKYTDMANHYTSSAPCDAMAVMLSTLILSFHKMCQFNCTLTSDNVAKQIP
jgi:hypothetical protein